MLTATRSSRINISVEKKTKSIAKIFSKNIKVGDILFLFGDLGVGKTTFIKYLINNLQRNFNEKITEVPSPTFNLVNEYKLDTFNILHYDLYRIKNENELKNLGIFEDSLNQITLIEWPEVIKNYNLQNSIDLFFEYKDDFRKRYITISSKNNISFLNEFN